MGQGGFLWIINATSKVLKVVSISSYQMNAWKFGDILSQSKVRFYIEYEGGTKVKSDDMGEASFQLEGTDSGFQLLAHWPNNNGECGIKVDWSAIAMDDYHVFPPVLKGESFGKLGWVHNGSLSLLIMENGTTTSVPTDLPDIDSIVPSTKAYPLTSLYRSWMEYYSGLLGRLTLTEMTLPGTHDSGTCHPELVAGTPWIRTQVLSLAEQLDNGIRVLDLRIGQNSPGNYILCHDTWKTRYSLGDALKEVKDFLDSSSKEIVILDFHRFVILGGGSYDFVRLKQQITSDLSGYCLPPSSSGNTLATIWSSENHKERVVVAWNAGSPDSYMWPGVNQRWYSDANSLPKLYQCIKTDMLSPPAGMWAACSFEKSGMFATPHHNAKETNPTITNWYFGGSEFCEKANIISVDFFREFTNIVQASVIGSLLKAGRKEKVAIQ